MTLAALHGPESPTMTGASSPRTAFVLSGGASLGALQVGMLDALYEQGITPDFLVGTSVGAPNAAFVARGSVPEGEAQVSRVRAVPTSLAWVCDGAPRMEVAHVEVGRSDFTAVGTQLGPTYELRYRLEPSRLFLEVVGQRSLEVELADADFFDLGWSPCSTRFL